MDSPWARAGIDCGLIFWVYVPISRLLCKKRRRGFLHAKRIPITALIVISNALQTEHGRGNSHNMLLGGKLRCELVESYSVLANSDASGYAQKQHFRCLGISTSEILIEFELGIFRIIILDLGTKILHNHLSTHVVQWI